MKDYLTRDSPFFMRFCFMFRGEWVEYTWSIVRQKGILPNHSPLIVQQLSKDSRLAPYFIDFK
jgi:hypothetical protein